MGQVLSAKDEKRIEELAYAGQLDDNAVTWSRVSVKNPFFFIHLVMDSCQTNLNAHITVFQLIH